MTEPQALAEARAHGFTFESKTASGATDFEVGLRGISLGTAPRNECIAFARGVAAGLERVRELKEAGLVQ